jgi:hypothetical protein
MERKGIAWLEALVLELENGLEAEWTEEALIYIYVMKMLNIYYGAVRKEESGEPMLCARKGWI